MSMKPCRECHREISSHAKTCPHCGIAKPFKLAIQRGLDGFAGWAFKRGLLIIILGMIGTALAADHQWVAGDALEVGERYHLEKMETQFLNVPRQPMYGVMLLSWRKLIKVYERELVDGELWYYVKAIRMETLNPRDHHWGWISAAELRALGGFAE